MTKAAIFPVPVTTQTCLPSVTGEGVESFCLRWIWFLSSSSRSQSLLPSFSDRQINSNFGPPGSSAGLRLLLLSVWICSSVCFCSGSGLGSDLEGEVMNCTDSDGGKNYYVKGTASDAWDTEADYCVSNSELYESWCEDAGDGRGLVVHGGGYICPGGCGGGVCLKLEQGLSDLTIERIDTSLSPSVGSPERIDFGVKITNIGNASSGTLNILVSLPELSSHQYSALIQEGRTIL